MTAIESFPGPSGVVDSIELRKNLSSLIVRDVLGAPRAGVFPRHSNALVTSTATTGPMTVAVSAFEAALVREGGPLFMQNDGSVAVTIGAAPVSNSRIDVVYVRQNESAAPMSDGSNTAVIAVAEGTAAASPTKPSIPVGALELATVTVPAGVTATNAGGVVITNTYVCTATSGGVVRLRNAVEANEWNPADGSLAFRLDLNRLYRRSLGAWIPAGPVGLRVQATTNASGIVTVANPAAPVAPTVVTVQVQQGPAGETQIRTIDAVVWDTSLGTANVQIRFRAEDTNSWAATQVVAFFIVFGWEA